MIIHHPCQPSHLYQDPDSISRTFLEQFGLVARTSLSPFSILAILILSSFQSESTAARLISFSIVGSVWLRWGGVGWADGGKLEALYNKPTTDLHPHVFLSDSQPWLGKIGNLENKFWQLFCHLKGVC